MNAKIESIHVQTFAFFPIFQLNFFKHIMRCKALQVFFLLCFIFLNRHNCNIIGLPRDLAYRLASQTVLGSGQLVRDSGIHPGKLKDDVSSPAGSTASGLWHLEAHGK